LARQADLSANAYTASPFGLAPGQTLVLLPVKEAETDASPVANPAPLRHALIDDNTGQMNVVLCEADYRVLKRGIEHLPPPTQ
jgi:hypothetical protein